MLSAIINFIKDRQSLPVIAVFVFCFILMLLPTAFRLSISSFFISVVYLPFTMFDDFLTDVARAKINNIELNQRLIQYSIQASSYVEDHYENNRLRRMLDFDLRIPYRLVPAKVIGLKPTPHSRSIEINAGLAKGINVNMPVVTADGIVGKTITVSKKTSIVQLLTDHNCKVSVIDQKTRAMGIARWQGGKLLEMGDVPIESKVAVGDTVISSGLGGIFPSGLMVGVVIFSQNREGNLFKDVLVKPAVDFNSLEEVFVVIYGQ